MDAEFEINNREPSQHAPADQMRLFVRNAGGRVRFDVFAQEHLAGAEGFYSHQIDLSRDHAPVATPMSMNPGYRRAYAYLVLLDLTQQALRNDRTEVTMLEIGPGGGELRAEIAATFEKHSDRFFPLEKVQYLALDPNQAHLQKMQELGAETVQGTIQKIPLETDSIDLIVAEEVLDALPYRKFFWDKQMGVFTGELFVELSSKGDLETVPGEVERDKKIDALEKYLKGVGYQGETYAYSPDYQAAFLEMRRVLKPQGTAFISDYSIAGLASSMATGLNIGHEMMAVRDPYGRDLTHFIDFSLMRLMAISGGFGDISIRSDMQFFDAMGSFITAIEVAVGGRQILRASGTRLKPQSVHAGDSPSGVLAKKYSFADLQAMSDGTHGCNNVIRALSSQPEAMAVVDVFKRHGLRGGAFWLIYNDIADRNIREFVRLVVAEDRTAIEYAKSNMEPIDSGIGGRSLPWSSDWI